VKITIVQEETGVNFDRLSPAPDAEVTVEFDGGTGMTFKCQTQSVLDPNGQESSDLSDMGYFARENGTFTISFNYVRDVDFRHAPARAEEEDRG